MPAASSPLGPVLDAIARAGSAHDPAVLDLGTVRQLLAAEGVAADLVAAVAGAPEPVPAESLLFDRLLDEARMDVENRGGRGDGFLAAVTAALRDLAEGDALTVEGAARLASGFARTGLPVPDVLTDWVLRQPPPDAAGKDGDAFISRLIRQAGKDAYALHEVLTESLAVMPVAVRADVVTRLGRRPEPVTRRLLLYWLLDTAPEVRLAAAAAVEDRLRRGDFDRAAAVLLVGVRSWMPADLAREVADRAIRAAQRTLMAVPPPPSASLPPVVERAAASLPDGTGSQHVMVHLRAGRQHRVALVLLKTGHGVKDAFVTAGRASEMRDMVARITEISVIDVDLPTVAEMIGAALGEGLDAGRMPPVGLVDVLDVLPLDALHPVPATLEAWRDRADPGGEVAAMTPQKRGRLIGESRDWPEQFDMLDSWFEDDAGLSEALEACGTRDAAARAVWRHLEGRRAFWARQMLRAAHVARAGGAIRAAHSFAATGAGVLDDRPLRRIPVFEDVVEMTLEAFLDNRQATAPGGGARLAGALSGTAPGDGPSPADMDALSDHLDGEDVPEGTLSLSALDGFLTACALCPQALLPSAWLSHIWGGTMPAFRDEAEAERIMQTVLGRYNQIIRGLQAGRHGPLLFLDDAGRPVVEEWANGFLVGVGTTPGDVWKAIERSSQASQALMLIALASDSEGGPEIPATEEQREEVRETLRGMLPILLEALWMEVEELRRAPAAAPAPVRKGPKTGRNAPCPCGSGRKYKVCCGA